MALRVFTVPIHDDGTVIEELNAFLRSHKVLTVDRRWVEQGASSFWSLCVDFLDSTAAATGSSARSGAHRNRVDYKEVLGAQESTIFAKLRELRKMISQQEAVPVYTVFTNEQLAEMARSRVMTKADMEKIAGVGEVRIEKYGPQFLELMGKEVSGDAEASA